MSSRNFGLKDYLWPVSILECQLLDQVLDSQFSKLLNQIVHLNRALRQLHAVEVLQNLLHPSMHTSKVSAMRFRPKEVEGLLEPKKNHSLHEFHRFFATWYFHKYFFILTIFRYLILVSLIFLNIFLNYLNTKFDIVFLTWTLDQISCLPNLQLPSRFCIFKGIRLKMISKIILNTIYCVCAIKWAWGWGYVTNSAILTKNYQNKSIEFEKGTTVKKNSSHFLSKSLKNEWIGCCKTHSSDIKWRFS